MNRIDDCLKKRVEETRYEFGLSPLHSWIRFFEYFIHLAYRLDFKKWQARTAQEKEALLHRKKFIQLELRSRLGLLIDKPRSGGSGNSNDGNTARKFFRNSNIVAEVTGLNRELIDKCHVILQCLASGYDIRKDAFQTFAINTARLLVREYPWFNMPPSVHKVLVHGSDVIDNALISIGELSEEAAESNNKNIKDFRRNYTRKISRTVTNTDLLHRLLLNSDPLITGIRKIPRQKKSSLPDSVKSLLYV